MEGPGEELEATSGDFHLIRESHTFMVRLVGNEDADSRLAGLTLIRWVGPRRVDEFLDVVISRRLVAQGAENSTIDGSCPARLRFVDLPTGVVHAATLGDIGYRSIDAVHGLRDHGGVGFAKPLASHGIEFIQSSQTSQHRGHRLHVLALLDQFLFGTRHPEMPCEQPKRGLAGAVAAPAIAEVIEGPYTVVEPVVVIFQKQAVAVEPFKPAPGDRSTADRDALETLLQCPSPGTVPVHRVPLWPTRRTRHS